MNDPELFGKRITTYLKGSSQRPAKGTDYSVLHEQINPAILNDLGELEQEIIKGISHTAYDGILHTALWDFPFPGKRFVSPLAGFPERKKEGLVYVVSKATESLLKKNPSQEKQTYGYREMIPIIDEFASKKRIVFHKNRFQDDSETENSIAIGLSPRYVLPLHSRETRYYLRALFDLSEKKKFRNLPQSVLSYLGGDSSTDEAKEDVNVVTFSLEAMKRFGVMNDSLFDDVKKRFLHRLDFLVQRRINDFEIMVDDAPSLFVVSPAQVADCKDEINQLLALIASLSREKYEDKLKKIEENPRIGKEFKHE